MQHLRSMVRSARGASTSDVPVRELQLASLGTTAPDGPEWLHEQKFDGYRMLADKRGGERGHEPGDNVRLFSRRFKDWTAAFPSIAAALARLPGGRVVLDGEVAVVLPDGRTSFQALQNALGGAASGALVYFAFDLLILDGEDLMPRPLEERKQRLAELLAAAPGAAPVVRYSDHVIGGGPAFFALACKAGLEGIISKRRDRPYAPGRSEAWRKTKCLRRQEFVIGGFTEPAGSRTGLGSLLLGYHEGGALVYAGKVGTGFSMQVLGELRAALEPLEQAACPFTPAPPRALTGATRHWVAPRLVAEVAFGEWTHDGRLRHPTFLGLRADKPAREVVRERPLGGDA